MNNLCDEKLCDGDTFEQLGWERMERAYEGFLRSLWREDLGCYVETNGGWLGEYHTYRNRAKRWTSDEDRHRTMRLVESCLDPVHLKNHRG